MAGKENVVQGAIVAALEVYCDRNWIGTDLFAPYANQQGAAFNKYCADLIVKLSTSKLILLEIKELDVDPKYGTQILPSYNPIQHVHDWKLELKGVPIQYAYARVDDLSYLRQPRERQWPNTTLFEVYLCKPSELFGSMANLLAQDPDSAEHSNLLEWLLLDRNSSSATTAAQLINHLLKLSTHQLRNKILILASVMPGGNQVMTISALAARELLESREGLDEAFRSLSRDLPQDFLDAARSVLASVVRSERRRGTIAQPRGTGQSSPEEEALRELAQRIEDRINQQTADDSGDHTPKPRGPRT
ncbi:hypothetical protein [Pseudoxanthomonas putridarboris]|uniref:Transposase, YhgA-like n=1 Tax=Pseudoxanthomonas putridarboris TaxID=752605 RepID=A0ABU9J430_9GAMM